MRLAHSNIAVDLRIAGYQFPDNHTDLYDSNWLIIEGRITHPRGSWSFHDPALLTYEAASLADWLEEVSGGKERAPFIGFTEPVISFEIERMPAVPSIVVLLALEARPAWAAPREPAAISFPLAEVDLMAAASEWREQLKNFRQRAER